MSPAKARRSSPQSLKAAAYNATFAGPNETEDVFLGINDGNLFRGTLRQMTRQARASAPP